MNRWIHLLTAAAMLFAAPALAADKLAWKFRPQEKFIATVEQEIVGRAMLDKKEVLTGTRAVVRLGWETEKVEAGQATVKLKFERLLVVFVGAGQAPVRFDSAAKENPAEAKEVAGALQPLVGAELHLRIEPTGKIAAVEASADTQRLLRRAAASGRLKQVFSPEGLEKLLRLALPRLPEGGVSLGDKWEDESSSETALGPTKTVYRSTYRGEALSGADKRWEWSIEPAISFADGTNRHVGKLALGGEPVEAITTISAQAGSGRGAFDLQAGRLLSLEMKHEMTLETKLPTTTTKQQITTLTKSRLESAP